MQWLYTIGSPLPETANLLYQTDFDAKIHECKLILSFKNSQIEGLKNL